MVPVICLVMPVPVVTNWGAALDPTDRPDFRPEPVDVEAAVRRALNERTDIAIVKKNMESNDVTLRYLKDQLLPQADLVGLYGVSLSLIHI